MTATAATRPRLDYAISDADQHVYESAEMIAEYLDPAFRHNFQLIQLNGRTTLMLNERLYRLVPNPTYNPVARPGSMVDYFRGNNPQGRSLKEICGPLQPFDPAFRYREPRLRVLEEQGVDFVWMLPTLALGLEEMLWETPPALAGCARAINRWAAEEWTFNIDDRVHFAGVLSFIDPIAAEAELDLLLEAGCRLIAVRPAPVRLPGIRRSIGDPLYDRVLGEDRWIRCGGCLPRRRHRLRQHGRTLGRGGPDGGPEILGTRRDHGCAHRPPDL